MAAVATHHRRGDAQQVAVRFVIGLQRHADAVELRCRERIL
jgi:hypothetical protein